MDATAVNCGHTFCKHCLLKWQRQKTNCPICREEITHRSPLEMLDQFIDKMYEKFVAESVQAARTKLREERDKEPNIGAEKSDDGPSELELLALELSRQLAEEEELRRRRVQQENGSQEEPRD